MLRLRPSELVLTPTDIGETYRRMARRKAATPQTTLPMRTSRALRHSPPGPRLRRGPDRSRDDAVASLGNIPILTPHQVIHVSVDNEDSSGQDEYTEPLEEGTETIADDEPTLSLPSEQTPPIQSQSHTPAREARHSAVSTVQLPFRPASRDARVDAPSTSAQNAEEEATPSPSKRQYGFPEFGRARTNTSEDANEAALPSRLSASTDGLAEASTANFVSERSQSHSPYECSSHTPSPLHQAHAVGSLRSQETLLDESSHDGTQREGLTMRYLQGYFRSPQQYTFTEYRPQTEPRQRPERSAQLVRSMSSTSDPAHMVTVQRPNRSESSTAEDTFWTAPAPEPPLFQNQSLEHRRDERERTDWSTISGASGTDIPSIEATDTIYPNFEEPPNSSGQNQPTPHGATPSLQVHQRTSQRFSSEASNSSFAYSVYELPDSRRSSQGEPLSQSQYDGAAPSRYLSRGAYYSIRPSQFRAANDDHPQPQPQLQASNHSLPNFIVLGQHNVSPLPSSPYARIQSTSSTPRLSTGLISESDFVGNDRDAASAAVRDLSSPLDLVEQRATSYFNHLSQSHRGQPDQPNTAAPSVFQYQIEDFDVPRRQRRPSVPNSVRNVFANHTYGRAMTSRGYWDRSMSQQQPRYNERPPVAGAPPPRPQRRAVQETRTAQRSSENVPVSFSYDAHSVGRNPQVQNQRVSIGHVQQGSRSVGIRGGDIAVPPIPLRHSIPQGSSPRDMSNRPRSSPYQPSATRPSLQHHDDELFDRSPSPYRVERQTPQAQVPTSLRVPRIPPRYGSRQHESELHRHNPTRVVGDGDPHSYHEHQAIPPPIIHPPLRRSPVSPVTAFEYTSGTMSRRRPTARAPTSRRRLPPHQQNQENSGDAEADLMREEIAAAGMRYTEDRRLDVMDETPPRLGRFERHMS